MKDATSKVLVVIPARDEEGRVGEVVQSVKRILSAATVLVVDDCSVDATREEAFKAGAVVVTHAVNLGYGAALETGYLYASLRRFSIVVQMDGDGQHLAEEIPKILDPVMRGEADVVVGSRYLQDASLNDTSLPKRLGQKLFSGLYFLMTGRSITDPTSGFQCLGPKALKLYTTTHFPEDYPDVDVLLMCYYADLTMIERPVRMIRRSGGRSMHSGLLPLYYLMKMCLALLLVVLGSRRWKEHVS